MYKDAGKEEKQELVPLQGLKREKVGGGLRGSPENKGPEIRNKSGGQGIDSPGSKESVYKQTQKKALKKEKVLVSKKRIKKYKGRIKHRGITVKQHHAVEYKDLKRYQKRNPKHIT